MATVALVGLLTGLFVKFVGDSAFNLNRVQSENDLVRINERLTSNLHESIQSAQTIFCYYADQAPGPQNILSSYNSLIAAGEAASTSQPPAAVAFSALPTAFDSDSLTAAVAGNNIGNRLMFAANIPTLKMTVQLSASPVWNTEVSLDRYQFVDLYLGSYPNTPIPAFGLPAASYGTMQLVEWRSIPFVNYTELLRFSGNKLTQTCKALSAAGYNYAWDPGQTNSAAAFYAITASSPYLATTGGSIGTLAENSWSWVTQYDKVLRYDYSPAPIGRVQNLAPGGNVGLYKIRYGIAYNTAATTSQALRMTSLVGDYAITMPTPGPMGGQTGLFVPVWANPDSVPANSASTGFPGGNGFPGGFEVAVFGQAGARKVYTRVVSFAASGADRPGKTYRANVTEIITATLSPY
jgi:hypothetical protein